MEDSELHKLVAGDLFAAAVTPAVLIDTERVRENIATTLRYLGSAQRWRPHVKTARLRWTVDSLLETGISRFKASTLSEVALLLEAGAQDVLLAFPAVGPTQWRLVELAAGHPKAKVSALVDHSDAVRSWRPGPIAAFLDVDTGDGRTGVPVNGADEAVAILRELRSRGFEFLGLHAYDGHLADLPEAEQQTTVTAELHDLVRLAEHVEAAGFPVAEIVAGSSHTFIPGARTHLPEPWDARMTFGPGTVVYTDLRSLDRFGNTDYRWAAFVLSRVISRQGERGITLDAGLTAIQVDAGRPHARLLGLPAEIGAPSQEHLKVSVGESERVPAIGETVLLVPRHIDTTIAQFDRVYLVGEGSVRESATVLRPF